MCVNNFNPNSEAPLQVRPNMAYNPLTKRMIILRLTTMQQPFPNGNMYSPPSSVFVEPLSKMNGIRLALSDHEIP